MMMMMMMMSIILKNFLLLLAIILVTTTSTHHANATSTTSSNLIQMLRPRTGSAGYRLPAVNCLSWRLAVETNNLRNKLVPGVCEDYVGHYMLGEQYRKDCEAVADIAIEFSHTVKPAGDGKDIWVFDIDETSLSNLPYYARPDVAFGAIAYNATKFNEWVREGIAPAVPAVLRLYKKLLRQGFKVVFLTGTDEEFREVRVKNLKEAGYEDFEKLILKGESDQGSSVEYKSRRRTELVEAGYRIVGNVGDQWSDLLGPNAGVRTFKIPDPMYYIG